MSEGYNGWSSYETWLASLWFGDIFTDMGNDGEISADILRDFVEEMLSSEGNLPESGFAADIMNAALMNVNWHELADHYQAEEEPEDDGQPDEAQEWSDFDPDC
jgi:hypothetical protein